MARELRIPYTTTRCRRRIRMSRNEFDEGFQRLESVDFPAERTADNAWRHFKVAASTTSRSSTRDK